MLKVEFHSHTNYIQDTETDYGPKELIDHAVRNGYDVLCITEHYWPNSPIETYRRDPFRTYEDFRPYAEEKGILLIRATEFFFKEGEVLLINFNGDLGDVRELKDLERLPESVLKIVPHPFFLTSNCLGDKFVENIGLFDAVEHSFFYRKHFNLNRKAIRIAKERGIPLVGTSDLHNLRWMGYNYTLVDADKDPESIVRAVRGNKIKLVTQPLPWKVFLYATYFHSFKSPSKLLFKLIGEIRSRI